jgi:Tol biopolymer transport system component
VPLCQDTLLFHAEGTGDWDIYNLFERPTNITNMAGSNEIQPSYSMDNQWIAFITDRHENNDDNWELYVIKEDGTGLNRLTFNTATDLNPVWGPGNRLLFESDRENNWELYLLDVSVSRNATRITDDEASDINPFWLDANNIIFQSDRDGDWEIYQLNLQTDELTQLTDNAVDDTAPTVSHNGRQMLWLQADESDSAVDNLWLMDLPNGSMEQITGAGTTIEGHVFAPADNFAAFDMQTTTGYDVFAVDLVNKDADGNFILKNLTDDPATADDDAFADRSPTFLCNQPDIYFSSDRIDNQNDLYSVNPLPLSNTDFVAPTRLTTTTNSWEIYPVGEMREELNSRDGDYPR